MIRLEVMLSGNVNFRSIIGQKEWYVYPCKIETIPYVSCMSLNCSLWIGHIVKS